MKHLPQLIVDCKVPQRVGSEDSGLCMRRSTGGCTPNHQKRPPSKPDAACQRQQRILQRREIRGIRAAPLNEENLVLQSLETSPHNIPEEENHSTALQGGETRRWDSKTQRIPKGWEASVKETRRRKAAPWSL
ncbi:UNVERIFIED_CONTAM: hypothetical protein FKN15_052434 [Acipenser sinensis]